MAFEALASGLDLDKRRLAEKTEGNTRSQANVKFRGTLQDRTDILGTYSSTPISGLLSSETARESSAKYSHSTHAHGPTTERMNPCQAQVAAR